MATVESSLLTPKSVGQTLSTTWHACTGWAGASFVIGAVTLLPGAVMMAFAAYVSVNLGVQKMLEGMQSGGALPSNFDVRALVLLGAYQLVTYTVWFGSTFFANAGIARVVAERATGRKAGAVTAFEWMLREIGRLLPAAIAFVFAWFVVLGVAAVVAGLASAPFSLTMGPKVRQPGSSAQIIVQVVSIAAMLIPVSIFGAFLSPMAPAVAVERKGGFGAIGRGFGLVSGNFGRVFLANLALTAVAGVPAAALGLAANAWAMKPLQAALGEANGALAATVPQTLAMLLLSPIALTLPAILYLDLRLRRTDEEFSATELAYDLGYEPPVVVPRPPLASPPLEAESPSSGPSAGEPSA